jgi:hypothetical protein
MPSNKKQVIFFVSYARENKRLASSFLSLFDEQIGASKRYDYKKWQDYKILPGENWHKEIQKAIKECDFGLLLISPSFLGSAYIKEHELPHFTVKNTKPVCPVMLRRVSFERQDLLGLEEKQIFRLESDRFKEPRAFSEISSARQEDYAYEFFLQVESRLDKHFI